GPGRPGGPRGLPGRGSRVPAGRHDRGRRRGRAGVPRRGPRLRPGGVMTTPTFPPGSGRTPGAEVTISEDLVRGLIADQHPDLADLPLSPAAEGWDNQVWRLGPDLAVRLPRRAQAAP